MPDNCQYREATGRAALFGSYWLEAFSRGFFIFTQPMRISAEAATNGAQWFYTCIWVLPKMSPLLCEHAQKVAIAFFYSVFHSACQEAIKHSLSSKLFIWLLRLHIQCYK
jgi:hypothetical protein